MLIRRLLSHRNAVLFSVLTYIGRTAFADAVDVAATFVGQPYHLGCKDPNGTGVGGQSCEGGFDCTGLVQYSYGKIGVQLPPAQQYLDPKVTKLTDQRCANPDKCTLQELISYGTLQRGDLLWFDSRTLAEGYDPSNKITGHVGIYEAGTTMINAFSDMLNDIHMGIRRDDLLAAQPPIKPDYWTTRFMFAGRVAVVPTATLLHRYPFQGDASDAVGSANGTLLGGAIASGGKLTLSGSGQYVQFGSHLVPTSGSYSVALFAQQSTSGGTIAEFISQGFSTGPGFYLGYFNVPGPTLIIRATDSWQPTGVPFPTDGRRHHYGFVVDASASQSRLYLDGVLRATFPSAIATTTAGTDTRLGRQFEPDAEYFHGSLSDVRVYSGALTGQEIANLSTQLPWLTFAEGNPGIPGDGKSAASPLTLPVFNLQTPISLAGTTDGFTLTVFPVGGNAIGAGFNMFPVNPPPGCPTSNGVGTIIGTAGTVTVNGVTGFYSNVTQSMLASMVSSLNQVLHNTGFSGCTLQLGDLSITAVEMNPTSLKTLDAAAFALGQNAVP